MYIKKVFDLIETRQGEKTYNVVPLSKNTLKSYEIDDESLFYLKNLVKMHMRNKNEVGSEYVLKNLDSLKIISLDSYPLPGFVTTSGDGYINIAAMSSSSIINYSTTDVYSLYLYTSILKTFITSKLVPNDADELISSFMFTVFMKMYRKKSGLTGAYKTLIPKLAFIIWLYIYVGMLGNPDTSNARRRIANNLYTDISDLQLDYDFTSIANMLDCLNENNIVTTSAHNFSTQVINYSGIASLPLFEDASRFFATLIASSIRGNSLFSSYWSKTRPDLFKRIVSKGLSFLSRSK